jgi:hypothetical protein
MLRVILVVLVGAAVLLTSADLAGRAANTKNLGTLEYSTGPARWSVQLTP